MKKIFLILAAGFLGLLNAGDRLPEDGQSPSDEDFYLLVNNFGVQIDLKRRLQESIKDVHEEAIKSSEALLEEIFKNLAEKILMKKCNQTREKNADNKNGEERSIENNSNNVTEEIPPCMTSLDEVD